MKVTASKPQSALLPEGTFEATFNSIKGRPNDEKPKKAALGFKVKDHPMELFKEVPISFDAGKPLRKDVETIRGKELTASEAEEGFDINSLKGKPCRVVVMHRAAAGGKTEAVVSVVLKAE